MTSAVESQRRCLLVHSIQLATLMAGQQAAAIGILAFNLEAMVFGHMYFVNMEPIEWKNE